MNARDRGIGEVLFPKVNPTDLLDSFESHLDKADLILLAACEAARAGRDEDEPPCHPGERYNLIIGLLDIYGSSIRELIEEAYRTKPGEAA